MSAATAASTPATTVGFSNKLEYHTKWMAKKSSDRDGICRAPARATMARTRRRFYQQNFFLDKMDYNNKLTQLRAGKSSKRKLLIAKFRSVDSLSGLEARRGTYFQDAVAAAKYDGGMDAKFEFTQNGDAVFSASCVRGLYSKPRLRPGAVRGLPGSSRDIHDSDNVSKQRQNADISQPSRVTAIIEEVIPGDNTAVVSACIIGLLTGISVVLFNVTVHGIREFCWDGIAYRGASWLREEPFELIWARVILVPACGGLVVSILNLLRSSLEGPLNGILTPSVSSALEPILKTVAACVTLGTGNSLGPEGPSVEIGASTAKGVAFFFDKGAQRKLSLRAAGSAAGISSGFNAAVAGCFFAVESVLWPSPPESSLSLTNTTSMVILSAVIASVVSEIGLGSDPAFTIPEYDFRSPSELPLYLLLGILCGLVSVTLTRCTTFMLESVTDVQKTLGLPKVAFPVLGGLAVGILALAYPEILYWGFENVDILLESRPFVKGLSVELLLQLVAIKILATSLCRASGLVGGYYAPSLFIGAATGMAYGKVVGLLISQSNPIFHLSILEVASPQAYGLVGMAATLAGVCQVPLTAVLLLFELTQDYRIVLPLLGAVGMSSWITSGQPKRRAAGETKQLKDENAFKVSDSALSLPSSMSPAKTLNGTSLCEVESSLCLYDPDFDTTDLAKEVVVSQAMRTKYVTALMSTLLREAVSLMLAEKQSCAVIVDDDGLLIGMLTLDDIQLFSRSSLDKTRRPEDIMVSEVCACNGTNCQISWTATPNMSLYAAQTVMDRYGISQVPVILEDFKNQRGQPIGLLDRECIRLACRLLFLTSTMEDS